MLPFPGNPINSGTAGAVPVPVIIPTPVGAMISFIPMPVASYPSPNIKIPTLLDNPEAAFFISSALLDSANTGKSFSSALMGMMVAELFGDDVQYDEEELWDIAERQGYAKTRVRFFAEHSTDSHQPFVYGLHTVEGTRYDEVRVRKMDWDDTHKHYVMKERDDAKPLIIWTPVLDDKDKFKVTGRPDQSGTFN